MKESEFRRIVKEEVRRVMNENKLKDSKDLMISDLEMAAKKNNFYDPEAKHVVMLFLKGRKTGVDLYKQMPFINTIVDLHRRKKLYGDK